MGIHTYFNVIVYSPMFPILLIGGFIGSFLHRILPSKLHLYVAGIIMALSFLIGIARTLRSVLRCPNQPTSIKLSDGTKYMINPRFNIKTN